MRGKVVRSEELPGVVGITPAYAGKSANTIADMPGDWDHPRACGEKGRQAWEKPVQRGSSPRMRGKVQQPQQRGSAPGITPAHAGKSCHVNKAGTRCKDHPRVCGEKSSSHRASSPVLGSPPRMRGKGFYHKVLRFHQGITPAYAGKSCSSRRCCGCCWDHPRACGEKGQRR